MLDVRCESCQAPYQVDERRVPAAGLRMRCPKCGHSFVVQRSAVAAGTASKLPAAKVTVVAKIWPVFWTVLPNNTTLPDA